jgi:hypothetical protein
MRWFRMYPSPIAVVSLVASVIVADAQRAAPAREPASRAAAILTWSPAKCEQYIAALDSMFLTRTVRASSRPHVLERGRSLPAFETGAQRHYVDQFMASQRVRGLVVLQNGRVRLERYAPPYGPSTRGGTRSRLRNRSPRRLSGPR